MGIINVLPKNISELIAAGEVIERPASIVKELLENSIDAKSTAITVEIKRGGITYIRITDNGVGLIPADMKIAFLRHATSKIVESNDLDSIGTLGFRGEALASISAVSKVEMISKISDVDIGSKITLEAGEEIDFDETGCADGTTIIVKDLFYNVPARLKFLKKDLTEANAIYSIVDKIALSHPEISFKLISDNKVKLFTPGNNDLFATVHSIYGNDFSSQLLKVNYESGDIKVNGLICSPKNMRSNRNMQHFFINSRYVRSKTCINAIEEAFKETTMVGKFPACVLNIDVDYSTVDVNVHPAKIEVRFTNERNVFDVIYFAVKSTLSKNDILKPLISKPINPHCRNILSTFKDDDTSVQMNLTNPANPANQPTQTTRPSQPSQHCQPNAPNFIESIQFSNDNQQVNTELYENSIKSESSIPLQVDNMNKANESTTPLHYGTEIPQYDSIKSLNENKTLNLSASKNLYNVNSGSNATKLELFEEENQVETTSNFEIVENDTIDNFPTKKEDAKYVKVLGEIFKTYFLFEFDDILYMMDKHAGHERILYEKLKKSLATDNRQVLLSPIIVSLSADEFRVATQNIETYNKLGFSIDVFGAREIIVREIPLYLLLDEVSLAIMDITQKIAENRKNILGEFYEELLHSIACRCAIKSNDNNSEEELTILLQRIMENDDIRNCPHGRPIIVDFPKYDIDKKFGRI